ncbi:MAG: hypothetical protein ABSF29_04140 [Tepidisphaeraceae bacterium]|jgi:hypothetical protein
MKFLTMDQMSQRRPEASFGESSGGKLVSGMVFLGLTLAALLAALGVIHQKKIPSDWLYIVAGVCGLLSVVSFASYRASLRPTNWLVRDQGGAIYIKFRSFRNDKMPTGDIQIVELQRSEIEWMRRANIRKLIESMGEKGGHAVLILNEIWLDLRLASGQTDELANRLREEWLKKGYQSGLVTHKSQDYPITIWEEGVVRLRWKSQYGRIDPGIDPTLKYFARWIKTAEPVSETLDATRSGLKKLGEAEQTAVLRRLAQTNPMEARVAATMALGISHSDAKKLIGEEN